LITKEKLVTDFTELLQLDYEKTWHELTDSLPIGGETSIVKSENTVVLSVLGARLYDFRTDSPVAVNMTITLRKTHFGSVWWARIHYADSGGSMRSFLVDNYRGIDESFPIIVKKVASIFTPESPLKAWENSGMNAISDPTYSTDESSIVIPNFKFTKRFQKIEEYGTLFLKSCLVQPKHPLDPRVLKWSASLRDWSGNLTQMEDFESLDLAFAAIKSFQTGGSGFKDYFKGRRIK
jgi:hypothetical protein